MTQATEAYLAEVRRLIGEARQTDYVMPVWLALLPAALGVLASLLAAFLAALAPDTGPVEISWEDSTHMPMGGAPLVLAGQVHLLAATAAGLVATVLGLYVLYKLVKRRNEHFGRVHRLYDNTIALLESMDLQDAEIVQMRNIVNEMKYSEAERSPGLWVILTLLTGLAGVYVAHFLNKDFHRHETREIMLYENLSAVFAKQGLPAVKLGQSVPDRSTLLYLLASILTLGLFGVYWLYTLVDDPNRHFAEHRRVEQQLLSNLERLVEGARAKQG